MKIVLIQVGRTTDKAMMGLIGDYCERVGHYIGFEQDIIPELRNTKGLTQEQQKQREGDLIMQRLKPGDRVLLLDERGKEMRSEEFADFINSLCNQSLKRLVFVIGGPYGFSPAVYDRADGKISLSRMTFSHQMVRLFFVEQLYRAFTIINGEPYHHA